MYKASYANYTDPGAGHVIVPAGTAMTIESMDSNEINFLLADGRKIEFEVQSKRVGMTVEEYAKLITSETSVSLDKFSGLDKKGIKEGRALVGMSKTGVMTALGYPAAHKTPSLESSSWVFWKDRFRTIRVDFDDKGNVVNIKD